MTRYRSSLTLAEQLASSIDVCAGEVTALAEINSGSFNVAGVDKCGERLAELAEPLNPDVVESVTVGPTVTVDESGRRGETPMGHALRLTKRMDAPFRVCVFGHLDTVFPADHPFQKVERHGDVLRGPGVADCKGGLVVALHALRHLDFTEWGQQVGWEFIAVPDEEVGSHGSKALLADVGTGCHLGLGVEPALPSGGIAAARKGSLTVHAIFRGRPSHVGRAHDEGRSAIRTASKFVDRLEDLNEEPGLTVNCGAIRGGGPLNVVPDFAIASFNIRVLTDQDHRRVVEETSALAEALSTSTEVDITVDWIAARPPKQRSAAMENLLADAAEISDQLDDPVVGQDTGGSCDGNDLAATGLVNLDSLGIRGGGIHSEEEFADLTSIPSRSAILAYLIERAAERHQAG